MSNVTKNNKNNLLDIIHNKKAVSVAVIIAITAMLVFSNAFVNPLLAQSSKTKDKTGSSKSKDTSDGTKTSSSSSDTSSSSSDTSSSSSDTSSSSSDKTNYKTFQKCLSNVASTKGFATQAEIKFCQKEIYPPTSSLPTGTSPSTSSTGTSPSTSSTGTSPSTDTA